MRTAGRRADRSLRQGPRDDIPRGSPHATRSTRLPGTVPTLHRSSIARSGPAHDLNGRTAGAAGTAGTGQTSEFPPFQPLQPFIEYIARSEQPTLEPTEPAGQIGRATPQNFRHVDAAPHRDIGPGAGAKLLDREEITLATGAIASAPAERHREPGATARAAPRQFPTRSRRRPARCPPRCWPGRAHQDPSRPTAARRCRDARTVRRSCTVANGGARSTVITAPPARSARDRRGQRGSAATRDGVERAHRGPRE